MAEHLVTIRSTPAYRGRQTLDPHRWPDYEVACSCGLSETFSKFSSADATRYVHLQEVALIDGPGAPEQC